MIDQIQSKVLSLQIAAIAMVADLHTRLRSQRGQGSAEYVGVIIVAAALVGILITTSGDWADALKDAVQGAINKVTSPGT